MRRTTACGTPRSAKSTTRRVPPPPPSSCMPRLRGALPGRTRATFCRDTARLPPTAALPLPTLVQFGEEAVKEGMGGGGGGGGAADIFDLFGMGGGRRGSQRERRSEDVVHK